MRGIFITGTDTNVGKTIISCGIAKALSMKGINVGVMKPIATGCIKSGKKLISEDAVFLKESINSSDSLSLINPITYYPPLSPYTSAQIAKKPVDLKKIWDSFNILKKKYDFLIVEGIGGIMVPINDKYFVGDLIKEMQMETLIISRTGLGTINHTLLTLEYAKIKKITIKGIIFNNAYSEKQNLANKTNPKIINKLSNTKILGTLPYQKNILIKKDYNAIADLIKKHVSLDEILY